MGHQDSSNGRSSGSDIDGDNTSSFLVRIVLYLLILLLGIFVAVFGLYLIGFMSPSVRKGDVLVMYVFSNTDPTNVENLRFFLREGVRADDGCDYVFVIQEGEDMDKLDKLPSLPPNARYEFHTSQGLDWGAFGWLIKERRVNINKYNYFVFINSSVRGPFIPAYLKGVVRWVDLFITKLNNKVKLVGPTISCEGSPKDGDRDGVWRANPHIQSYAFATDRIGLQIMIDDSRVFESYESQWDTVYYSELGASNSILEAGYNIDSFMMRYQNVNWLDQGLWSCNQRTDPTGQFWYDGISLHPFEVLFVKVDNHLLVNRWDFVRIAHKYDKWMEQAGKLDLLSNEWKDEPTPFKVPFILAMERRGIECFDVAYYKQQNGDLNPDWGPQTFFTHFTQAGQFEGRQFRFSCEANFSSITHTFV